MNQGKTDATVWIVVLLITITIFILFPPGSFKSSIAKHEKQTYVKKCYIKGGGFAECNTRKIGKDLTRGAIDEANEGMKKTLVRLKIFKSKLRKKDK